MSEERKRDKLEYLRGYKIKKKEEAKMIKREKMERYYMGKEDVDVVAATLAPPSQYSTLPSAPSFDPAWRAMEDASNASPSACLVEPRYTEGEVLLLEANTKERGCVYPHFLFFTSHFVSFLGTKRRT